MLNGIFFSLFSLFVTRKEPYNNNKKQATITSSSTKTMKPSSIALVTALALLCPGTLSVDIENKDEFGSFSKKVSLGNTYKGKTIYLINDIDMSGKEFAPMGTLLDDGSPSYFQGTFDGQGHVISNLNITSPNISVGLFGIIYGGSVKNVVLDSSCSVTIKNTQHFQSYLGGLVGTVFSMIEPVTIQNCVNMAKISVIGPADILLAGGIVGHLGYDGYNIELYNCMNMGNIHTEEGDFLDLYIGGIVGYMDGKDSSFVLNCLNFGNITVSEKNNFFITMGGIVGELEDASIFNCVNMGTFFKIPDATSFCYALQSEIVGVAQGEIYSCYSPNITFNDTIKLKHYYECGAFDENYMLLNEISIGDYTGKSLISALNVYPDIFYFYELSWWLLNKNEKKVSILASSNINKTLETTSSLVLLTQVSDNYKYHFFGWYNDAGFNTPLTTYEVDKDTKVYGKYELNDNEYTLTFNTGGKLNIDSMKVKYGDVVTLPEGVAGEERIGLWEYRAGDISFGSAGQSFVMPAYDLSLYARWVKIVIRTPNELKELSDNVNMGVTCKGLTITLENDLDMEGVTMNSIGNEGHEFGGTFDGKGHTIKNLYIRSVGEVSGLFGYSVVGMTVRNLILDESCSIIEYYYPSGEVQRDIDGVFTGGIIGFCYAKENGCILENSVNMGTANFNGRVSYDQSITGGLVGIFRAMNSYCSIVNSMFLGTIQISGHYDYGYGGGIAGSVTGDLDAGQSRIENCLNGGTIVLNKVTDTTYIGGIVGGFDVNTIVQNCVNIGSFEMKNVEESNVTTGQIAGLVIKATISNCYWPSTMSIPCYGEDGEDSIIGNSTGFNANFNLDKSISTESYKGYSLISALNSYTLNSNDLSKWAGNKNRANVSFQVDGKMVLSVKSRIVLMPTFSSQGTKHFVGWYEDSEIRTIFTDNEVFKGTRLYGAWRDAKTKYTVTFINEGKTVKKIDIKHGDKVKASNVKVNKKGYRFVAWVDEYGRKADNNYIMQTRDVVLTALWVKESLSSARDLIEFSEAVGRGANCEGRIIRLNDDIDMSGIEDFVPIGTSENPFKGTFEGNGHKISNLKLNASEQYSGFIGSTLDATVRNIVLDESCSVESNYLTGYGSVGGVIGYCGTEKRQCVVVNVINFAPVTYSSESSSDTMNLGGVIGLCQGFSMGCTIVNCANYGAITKMGTTRSTWLGGVIGKCGGDYDYATCRLWTSVNYGKISHIGKTTDLGKVGIGGILGACYENTNVSACVSGGEMSIEKARVWSIGGITGYNRDLCAYIENLWFWWVDYSGNSDKNPEINEDMTTSNGDTVLEALKNYSKTRTLPKEGIGKTYRTTWIVNPNNAKIKAEINKETIATYNSTIVLLPTLRDGNKYHFHGWKDGNDDVETSEVTKDTTFTGKWKKSVDKTLVVGLAVGLTCFVVLVIVAIILSLYAVKYLRWRKKRKNLRDLLYPKIYDKDVPEDSLNKKIGFYPEFYTRYGEITMREALKTAGLKGELANKVIEDCYKKARDIEEDNKLPRGLTVDDAAVIAMYTFDFGRKDLYDYNPYRIINNALRERRGKELEKAKDLIYILMKALRKLPVVHGKDLYRGIIVDAYERPNQQAAPSGSKPYPKLSDYKKGAEITWDALSSTSPDMEVTRQFLAQKTVAGKIGILFTIKGGWGYDVQPYSLFPKESEILVEPERQFTIEAVLPSEGLVIVNLLLQKTPILFPEVFGMHDLKTSSASYIKEKVENYGYEKRLQQKQSQNFDTMFSNDADWEGKDLETFNEEEMRIEAEEEEPEMVRGFVGIDNDDDDNNNLNGGGVEMQDLGKPKGVNRDKTKPKTNSK